MPPDFPIDAYESVHGRVVTARGNDPLYDHYAGAWNAVAYRFRGAIDSGESFVASMEAHGSTPEPLERYVQERALFEFFSCGFSVFDAAFYTLYTFGAFLEPEQFKLSSPREQQLVTPTRMKEAFERAFPTDPILQIFTDIFSDPGYQRWREIRNILTHRAAPGRRIYVSIGVEDSPPVEWKINNIPFNESVVTSGRNELARLTALLLGATDTFVKMHLTKS